MASFTPLKGLCVCVCFFIVVKIAHKIKCTTLTIFSVLLSSVKYIYSVVQKITRTFSSCKPETLDPRNTSSLSTLPLALETIFLFVSMI